MTGPITFRGGRAAPTPDAPRLRLAPHLDLPAALAAMPDTVDWVTPAAPYDMLGNDQWGDCVYAEQGHHLLADSTLGAHHPVRVTTSDVLTAYSTGTGFDPQAGPPGGNPTDRGTNMQRAMGQWRKTGLAGHRIVAFAEVNVHDLDEVCAAIDLFGAVAVGVNFPASAMDQFNAGQPWDVVRHDGGIKGGHAIHVGGFDRAARTFTLTTWGRVVVMTWAWWQAYVEEAWAVLMPEWVDDTGVTPTGLDLHGLGAEFAALTGQPNPYPDPSPAPTPVPPAPVVPPFRPGDDVVVAAARALAADPCVAQWLAGRHHGLTVDVAAGVARVVAAVAGEGA